MMQQNTANTIIANLAKNIFHVLTFFLKKVLPRDMYWDVHSWFLNAANRVFGFTYALSDLDRKLYALLGKRNGVFVEAGAADGLSQSNTLLLERKYGWRGVLIEPIPGNFKKCAKYRDNSIVLNCLLSAFEQDGNFKTIIDGNLLSIVEEDNEESQNRNVESQHEVISSNKLYSASKYKIKGRSLSRVLDELGIEEVDVLSLDVEGNEIEVLKGINFERHYIKVILVETKDIEMVAEVLSNTFNYYDKWTKHDYVFMNKKSML